MPNLAQVYLIGGYANQKQPRATFRLDFRSDRWHGDGPMLIEGGASSHRSFVVPPDSAANGCTIMTVGGSLPYVHNSALALDVAASKCTPIDALRLRSPAGRIFRDFALALVPSDV